MATGPVFDFRKGKNAKEDDVIAKIGHDRGVMQKTVDHIRGKLDPDSG